MFCKHDWIKIGMPRHLKYDYSGNEAVIILCCCKKCGKQKDKIFYGRSIGNLFDGR